MYLRYIICQDHDSEQDDSETDAHSRCFKCLCRAADTE